MSLFNVVVVVTVLLSFLVDRINARTTTVLTTTTTTTFVVPYGKIHKPPKDKNNFVLFSESASSSSSSKKTTKTNKQYTTTTTTTSTSTSKSNSSNNNNKKKKITTNTMVDFNKEKNISNNKSRIHSKTKQQQQQQQQQLKQRKVSVRKHSKTLVQSQPKEQQQYQQYQRLPLPDIQTQLQYSRNGHAVLRNLFTSSTSSTSSSSTTTTTIGIEYLSNLRTILYEYSQEQQLKAWQQKVVVALDSNNANKKFNINPNTIQTIDECCKILVQLGIPANKLPFLQYFNCWKTIPQVQTLCIMLSEIASVLLDVESVRLYQDSLFYKRCSSSSSTSSRSNINNKDGDGPTPWHTDCKMCPFDTSNMITFWIPLQYIPIDGSGLQFCSKTHNDFALPYWNTQHLQQAEDDQQQESTTSTKRRPKISQWDRLEERYMNNGYTNYIDTSKNKRNNRRNINSIQYVNYMPLNIGDVTVHSGWTLHCADPCSPVETIDRLALAISYVDSRAPVRYDAQQSVLSLVQSNNKNTDNKRKASTHTPPPTITTADREDIWSYQDWVTEVPHDTFEWDHPLVPIVWPPPPPQSSS